MITVGKNSWVTAAKAAELLEHFPEASGWFALSENSLGSGGRSRTNFLIQAHAAIRADDRFEIPLNAQDDTNSEYGILLAQALMAAVLVEYDGEVNDSEMREAMGISTDRTLDYTEVREEGRSPRLPVRVAGLLGQYRRVANYLV